MDSKMKALCESLLGTPHINKCADPAVGLDCINFVLYVYRVHYGMTFKVPENWDALQGLHKKDYTIFEHLKANGFVPTTTPKDGDVVIFKAVTQSNHFGLLCDGFIYHSLANGGVVKHRADLLRKSIDSVWTLIL